MKATTMTMFAAATLAILTAPPAARASGNQAVDRCLAPYFKIEGGETSLEQFPLRETDTSVSIAAVEVKQVYVNRGAGPIEAVYIFPASTRAAVHGMEMRIGERHVRAKIREREEAKESYEQAKEQDHLHPPRQPMAHLPRHTWHRGSPRPRTNPVRRIPGHHLDRRLTVVLACLHPPGPRAMDCRNRPSTRRGEPPSRRSHSPGSLSPAPRTQNGPIGSNTERAVDNRYNY